MTGHPPKRPASGADVAIVEAPFGGDLLHGGATLFSRDGAPVGSIGLLVREPGRGKIVALTHVGAAGDADGPYVKTHLGLVALGANQLGNATPLMAGDGTRSCCALVAGYLVPDEIQVSAYVASLGGMDSVGEAVPPHELGGETVRLAVGEDYTEWTLRGESDIAVFPSRSGGTVTYGDVLELEPTGPDLPDGKPGGAIFFSVSGQPLGMWIGRRAGNALAAPLRPIMWRHDLEVVTPAIAQAHNGERTAVDIPIPSEATTWHRREAEALMSLRHRSYRFAIRPLRDRPLRGSLAGLDALRQRLTAVGEGWDARDAFLRGWLIQGNALQSRVVTVGEAEHAFAPLRLSEPARPARELMAALAYIHPHDPVRAAGVALDYLQPENALASVRERSGLWWILQEFFIRRDAADLRPDIERDVHRAVSVRLDLLIAELSASPDDGDLNDELFAIVETILALPQSGARDALLRAQVRRLWPFAPRLASFYSSRFILQRIQEAGHHALDVISRYGEFLGWIRGFERYEGPKQSPEDDLSFEGLLEYTLVAKMKLKGPEAQAILATVAGIPTADVAPPPSFAERAARALSDTRLARAIVDRMNARSSN